jgi:DNA-binding transcriptional regulator YiaG
MGRSDQYRSEAMAALHEAASDLYKAGGLGLLTMRHFDHLCLPVVENLRGDDDQSGRPADDQDAQARDR